MKKVKFRLSNTDTFQMQSVYFPTRGEVQPHNGLRLSRDKLFLSSWLFSTTLRVRCIVFGSHGSAATISALLFNFSYWPEPHCSPAFPNLGGIPPPGNMVYKKRHQAQLLRRPTPHYPSPSWQSLLCDPLYPFPFHPSSNIPTTPLPAGTGSPLDYPTRESHKRGAKPFSILTSRHTGTCVVHSWQQRKRGRQACVQMKVFNMTPLSRRAVFDHPEYLPWCPPHCRTSQLIRQ